MSSGWCVDIGGRVLEASKWGGGLNGECSSLFGAGYEIGLKVEVDSSIAGLCSGAFIDNGQHLVVVGALGARSVRNNHHLLLKVAVVVGRKWGGRLLLLLLALDLGKFLVFAGFGYIWEGFPGGFGWR